MRVGVIRGAGSGDEGDRKLALWYHRPSQPQIALSCVLIFIFPVTSAQLTSELGPSGDIRGKVLIIIPLQCEHFILSLPDI